MKRFLPKSISNPKGFTLVELLVVIAIIAILSIIGITIFTGIQKSARDAKRKADVNAIAQAMELNYGKFNNGAGYPYARMCQTSNVPEYNCAKWFAGGAIPRDPLDPGRIYTWCQGNEVNNGCNPYDRAVNSHNGPLASGPTDPAPDGRQDWAVCAGLEVTSTAYCVYAQQ